MTILFNLVTCFWWCIVLAKSCLLVCLHFDSIERDSERHLTSMRDQKNRSTLFDGDGWCLSSALALTHPLRCFGHVWFARSAAM